MITLGWAEVDADRYFKDKDGGDHRVSCQTSNGGDHDIFVDGKHHARVPRSRPRSELKKAYEEVIAIRIADGWVEIQTPKKFFVDELHHWQCPSSMKEMDAEKLKFYMERDLAGSAYDNNAFAEFKGPRGRPTTFSEWALKAEVSDAFEAPGKNGFTFWFVRRD